MNNPVNIQDSFLNQLRKDSIISTIYLINGVQIRGYIRGFDNFIILVETNGKTSMIFKHAISTVIPQS